MSHRQALSLLLLCAPLASAQEPLRPRFKPVFCFQLSCETPERSHGPLTRATLLPEELRKPTGTVAASAGELDLPALEQLHQDFHRRFSVGHNPFIYSLAARSLTSLYSRPTYLFKDWYRRAQGIDLLHLAGGRLAFGFETRRVLVFEGERNPSPLRDPGICNASGFLGAGPCGALPFDAGERTYSFSLRWKLE